MNSDDTPSDIALNTWALGEFEWQKRTDPHDLIRTALQHDLSYLDCSPLYGQGRSEERVGEILDDLGAQSDCYLATKLGIQPSDTNSFVPVEKYASLRQQLDDSLQRLKRDRLDLCALYQNPRVSPERLREWGDRLQEDGRVKDVGFVVLDATELADDLNSGFDFVMKPGSLFDVLNRSSPVPSHCTTIGYDPLYGGLFDQQYAEVDSEVLDYEVRRHHPKFTANRVEYLSALKDVQHQYREEFRDDLSLESRTLAWLLKEGSDQHFVVGMRNAEDVHLALRAQAIDWSADNRLLDSIRSVWEEQGTPEFVTPPPLLPRHSFERHVLPDRIQW